MPLYDFFSIEYGVGHRLGDQIIHSKGLTSLVLQTPSFSRSSVHSLYYIAVYEILFGVESAWMYILIQIVV